MSRTQSSGMCLNYALQYLILFIMWLTVTCKGDCATEIHSFAECSKEEVNQRHESEAKESEGYINDPLIACFTVHNCSAPEFDAPIDKELDQTGKQHWKILDDWWEGLDYKRRQCIVAEVRGDFKDKLQECVAKKIVGFSISDPPASSIGQTVVNRKVARVLAHHRFRLQMAIVQCDEKSREIHTCLVKERQDRLENTSCATRKKCADSLKPECQERWKKEFKEPICTCVDDVDDQMSKAVGSSDSPNTNYPELITKCGVGLPSADIPDGSSVEFRQRLKAFVSLFDDRLVSFCNECDGVRV